MRWLMTLLLVSLVALLVAAAGVARHVWMQHKKLRLEPPADAGTFPAPAPSKPAQAAKKNVLKTKT